MLNRISLLLLLCSISACAGTSTSPGVACPALGLSALLIYPQNGSTNIVDTENVVVISSGSWTSITLTPLAGGSPVVSTQIVPVPNPLPEPHIAAAPSLETAFQMPTLAAATTYAVTPVLPQSGTCPLFGSSAGSFTTR